MLVHLTRKSSNSKTGPIPVSTTSSDTCPKSCPWNGKGCYADQGPLRLHWRKIDSGDRGLGFPKFLEEIKAFEEGQLWRHNQAGDLPGSNERINASKLKQLANASKGKRGFTYTHKPVEGSSHTSRYNRIAIATNNSKDFVINLSANGIAHADRLKEIDLAPVTTVVDSNETRHSFKSPKGNQITVCPATYKDTTCSACKLCAISNRKAIIAFPAHGAQTKKVNQALEQLT